MPQKSKDDPPWGRRYALCVGIGTYTELANRNLRYAVADAKAVAERLGDPQRGNFAVTLLTETAQTTKRALEEILYEALKAPSRSAEDIVVIYFSCHGSVYGKSNTFYLLPSDARLEEDGMPRTPTVLDIHSLASYLSEARVKNIIVLIDACYSGGAVITFRHLALNPNANLYIIGATQHDQIAIQSSQFHHGIFTNCLLRACEQRPSRSDGWITISQIHSFVAEEIKPLQIQAMSALADPNLPFIKNPHYSPQSLKFHEEVKKLLWLVQYEPVETDVPKGASAGFYVAEVKSGLRMRRVGIIPYNNKVEGLTPENVKKITSFIKEQVNEESLDEGLIVTNLEVSKAVKNIIRKVASRYLEIITYEDVWKNLIDFKKYLYNLVRNYETPQADQPDDPPLAKIYIPLMAEQRIYTQDDDLKNMVMIKSVTVDSAPVGGKDYKAIWQGDLEEEVKHWLADTDTSRLALLADYGGGKSTFCRHFAATLTKEYLAAKEQGSYEQRIPLLIPLGDFAKAPVDLEGYLVAHLKRTCKVDNPDFEALMRMAEKGLLVFMLDGFDEMAARATTDTVYQNIALFEKLANIPRNKVLLTTRPEYFMSLSQEQKALRSYPCLYLQPFNPKQINLYLQKRIPFLKQDENILKKDWTYYRKQIDRIHDLADLARRPVLLEIIIKTLPLLVSEGEAVNRPNLYQRYLEGELDRQYLQQRRDLLINRQKRFEIMEQIALELYRTGQVVLTSNQILKATRELLTAEQQGEMEGSLREILTCSFLIRIGDEWRFSHQSFLEYLVALRLAKDILENKLENFRLKPMSLTIMGFLVEFEERSLQGSSGISNAANTNISFNRRTLTAWFQANPRDKWVSSNVISLLSKLLSIKEFHKLPLAKSDLSDVDLRDMDLRKINFSRTILSGAVLSSANLSDVNLNEAVLSGANLDLANLTQAHLIRANLMEAHLNKSVLHKADLHKANLHRADLSEADLSDADLSEADLSDADLSEADLSYADLSGSYFNRAKLFRADLSEADLSDANLSGATMSETNLRDADLGGADLSGAILIGADLRNANLDAVKLTDADLSGANLKEVDLDTVDLRGTILDEEGDEDSEEYYSDDEEDDEDSDDEEDDE